MLQGVGQTALEHRVAATVINNVFLATIVITERRVLNFKASQLLKMSLNEERDAALDGDETNLGAASGQPAGGLKAEPGADVPVEE